MKSACVFLLMLLIACPAAATTTAAGVLGEIDGLQEVERSHAGEWIQLYVFRGEVVKTGQRLAVQRNAFGRVILEYVAGSSGEVKVDGRVALGPRNTTLEIEMVGGEDGCANRDCPDFASD
ncbi:hypothetical protein SAMN04487965_2921 [Microbulbifer donghaiensis]|uniref:Uncharacterized protein n=1 Tax=Microbulbifer donghaiensis TaxID=494016 RepID=A0A1M5FGW3_9GAMM|nr:hypothetical protein [Microbulbifer donghaiensis]SHF90790.1 hypothetical protein SAMN04487965_2921 [Microbulbifer donghaiensis]